MNCLNQSRDCVTKGEQAALSGPMTLHGDQVGFPVRLP